MSIGASKSLGVLELGVASVTFRAYSVPQVIEMTRAANLDCVEWAADVHVRPENPRYAREVGRWTTGAGLRVSSYGSYYACGFSETERMPFSQVLESASELGAPVVRVWAGRSGSAAADPRAVEVVVADLRRISSLAATHGLRVAMEFHGGTLNDTVAGSLSLLAAVEAVHTYWQPPIAADPDSSLQGLASLLPRLSNVHVFHWIDAGHRLPLSAGRRYWMRVLEVLRSSTGSHASLLEFVRGDSPTQFAEDAVILRECLAEVAATRHATHEREYPARS